MIKTLTSLIKSMTDDDIHLLSQRLYFKFIKSEK